MTPGGGVQKTLTKIYIAHTHFLPQTTDLMRLISSTLNLNRTAVWIYILIRKIDGGILARIFCVGLLLRYLPLQFFKE